MSGIRDRILERVLDRYFETHPNRKVQFSDLGFDEASEADVNRGGVKYGRFILPVSIYKPSTGTFPDPSSAAADDPLTTIFDAAQIHYTLANKTNPVFLTLCAEIASTHSNMTLESPIGTDYQVPTGKVAYLLILHFYTSGATRQHSIGYADTGVASGVAAGTNPVLVTEAYGSAAASTNYVNKVYASIPAGKFPHIQCAAEAVISYVTVYGVEVDV
mgnify:CR=1 FL=1